MRVKSKFQTKLWDAQSNVFTDYRHEAAAFWTAGDEDRATPSLESCFHPSRGGLSSSLPLNDPSQYHVRTFKECLPLQAQGYDRHSDVRAFATKGFVNQGFTLGFRV